MPDLKAALVAIATNDFKKALDEYVGLRVHHQPADETLQEIGSALAKLAIAAGLPTPMPTEEAGDSPPDDGHEGSNGNGHIDG